MDLLACWSSLVCIKTPELHRKATEVIQESTEKKKEFYLIKSRNKIERTDVLLKIKLN
jgi:hypothetical protein